MIEPPAGPMDNLMSPTLVEIGDIEVEEDGSAISTREEEAKTSVAEEDGVISISSATGQENSTTTGSGMSKQEEWDAGVATSLAGTGTVVDWADFAHEEDRYIVDSAEVWVEYTGPEMTTEAFQRHVIGYWDRVRRKG